MPENGSPNTPVARQELRNMQQCSNLEAVFSRLAMPITTWCNNETCAIPTLDDMPSMFIRAKIILSSVRMLYKDYDSWKESQVVSLTFFGGKKNWLVVNWQSQSNSDCVGRGVFYSVRAEFAYGVYSALWLSEWVSESKHSRVTPQ
jgi:hypothetical protein